ncbi:hypothetical protein FNF28_07821 [Cafeteria roenbergensis]|uniref:Uncharacterized protein n=1 Tax=Cafeteria roenbergensis TaxID=33653 RepID=A0A5A8BY45_CAFRO|nr:hypothetical protein FNF28_07821 [Cafeteria roenbergensis]
MRQFNGGLGFDDAQWSAGGRVVVTTQSRELTRRERDGASQSLKRGKAPLELCAVKVWDAATGELLHRLPAAHSGRIQALAMHPTDDRVCATGGADGLVAVWALDHGRMIRAFAVPGTNKLTMPTVPTATVAGGGEAVIEVPGITELKWGGSAGGVGAGTALLATDASGRVMVFDSAPAETMWHRPLSGRAGAPSGQGPGVTRAGADPITGVSDVPYAQYLSDDYDSLVKDELWNVTDTATNCPLGLC